jgi:DNA-binding transcriptional MerR regulator
MLTVKQVAEVSGVTVRTLHHYDQIGLLSPSTRSRAGYRLYDDRDLQRLQEVLFYRELGFGLAEIREVTGRPEHDRKAALSHHRELLSARIVHLRAMIEAVETALDAEKRGVTMTKEELFEVFGDFDPTQHEPEVEERWSGQLLDESRQRTRKYGKTQWQQIKNEGDGIAIAFAAHFRAGDAPDDEAVVGIAESHRGHIERWFYPCPPEMHVGLAQMYVGDPRFKEYWDKHEAGLAEYVKAAIEANAEAS